MNIGYLIYLVRYFTSIFLFMVHAQNCFVENYILEWMVIVVSKYKVFNCA